jgi:lipopolysaccharide transport system permease protein
MDRAQIGVVRQLAARQVEMRYRDSFVGLGWAVLSPLLLLAVYTVIYSTVFSARWPRPDGSEGNYALFIFSGLILFTLMAEILNSATFLVQGNAVLVKRTTLDVRLIPIASTMGSVFTFALSAVPLAFLYAIFEGLPPWTIVLYPLVVAVLWLVAAGAAWFLAALAPFFRDVQQVVPLVTTALLFLSPIFYSVDALPGPMRTVLTLVNPLMTIIPASQDLLFYGRLPNPVPLLAWALVGILLWVGGRAVFAKAAKGFGDVI